ncbi:MAG TPA: YEATS-associated helix-containing protein [Mucilaginibacter sp.]
MSFPVLVAIMLLCGIIGGIINCILPQNKDTNADPQAKGRTLFHCILIGIGATILVPLFLEIAQSKLLDNLRMTWQIRCSECVDCPVDSAKKADTKACTQASTDTTNKKVNDPILAKLDNIQKNTKSNSQNCIPLKSYLLFAAYCFLAAAAGPRFINNLMDSVLKEKTIEELQTKTKEATQEKDKAVEEKDKAEQSKEKLIALNQLNAKQAEANVIPQVVPKNMLVAGQLPQIGAITNPDDPQKGRFGGKSVNNGRALKATVTNSLIPDFYNVTIWVESTDNDRPLDSDVVFYLHDSFRPSVYSIKVNEFEDGKAIDKDILSYGAFTVGAVTDNGQTLLEFDLAEQPEFPKNFRDR